MLKAYQFQTQCIDDSHVSEMANIIWSGLVTKRRAITYVLRESWPNDICHFRPMTIALAVSFRLVSV